MGPKRYRDTHRQKVEALIEEKSQGKTIVAAKSAPGAKVVDLMEALQASVRVRAHGTVKSRQPNRPGPRPQQRRLPGNVRPQPNQRPRKPRPQGQCARLPDKTYRRGLGATPILAVPCGLGAHPGSYEV